MDMTNGPAAPASGSTPSPSPSLQGRGREVEDPEILALLDFEPVPRQREVEGGWTPELQREFIARLAVNGSARRTCDEMGKNQTGVMKLYRSPLGASFREAWDDAVALARRRTAERAEAQFVIPGTTPPTVDYRRKHSPSSQPSPSREEGEFEDYRPNEEEMWRLIESLGVKFLRKVAAEREARLSGEIVAADFYLRQITYLEVLFDLTATNFGWDAGDVLRELRCGKHSAMDVVSTPMADWLDRARRKMWADEGEPERPPHPQRRNKRLLRDADRAVFAHAFLSLFLLL